MTPVHSHLKASAAGAAQWLLGKRRRRSQRQRTQALPVSAWHVVLSWLDLATDILGALSTRQLALQLPSLCGMRTGPFFNCCFSIQVLLISGSMAMQVMLAVATVVGEQAHQPGGASASGASTSSSSSSSSTSVGAGSANSITGSGKAHTTNLATAGSIVSMPSSTMSAVSTANSSTPLTALPPKEHATAGSAAAPQASCVDCCCFCSSPHVAATRAACRSAGMLPLLWACVRGVTATELAYQEFWRHHLPSPQRTAAVMHIRLSELVFEGPQVVISWMVLLGRLTLEDLARVSGHAQHVDTSTKVLQWLSLVVGVLSLSIGCADFMRLHRRSMWAGPPPAVLLLGLIDVSRATWWRSALINAHAVFSLATRALIYIIASSLTLNVAFFDVRHNRSTAAAAAAAGVPQESWPTAALQAVFPLMLAASICLNAALLWPMRSWTLLPAAVINAFVNMPWICAPLASRDYGRLRSLAPVAVLQVLCAGAAVSLGAVGHHAVHYLSPCGPYASSYITWLGSETSGLGGSLFALLLPVAAAASEAFAFSLLAAVTSCERAAPGQPAGAACAPGAPALAYRFVWFNWPLVLCAVRVTGAPIAPSLSI